MKALFAAVAIASIAGCATSGSSPYVSCDSVKTKVACPAPLTGMGYPCTAACAGGVCDTAFGAPTGLKTCKTVKSAIYEFGDCSCNCVPT